MYVVTIEYEDDSPSVHGPFETQSEAHKYRERLLEEEGKNEIAHNSINVVEVWSPVK